MIDYSRNRDGWPSDHFLALAVLVGQADGEVFISDAALTVVERTQLTVIRDDVRGGYIVRLEPNTVDHPPARIDGPDA